MLALPVSAAAQDTSLRSISTELAEGQDSDYVALRCAGFYKTVFLVSGGEASENPLAPRARAMVEWLFASSVQTRVDAGEVVSDAATAAAADINIFHDVYVARIRQNLEIISEPFDDLMKSDLRVCNELETQRLAQQ